MTRGELIVQEVHRPDLVRPHGSLTILAEQSENERFQKVITAVLNDIQAGQTLADARCDRSRVRAEAERCAGRWRLMRLDGAGGTG